MVHPPLDGVAEHVRTTCVLTPPPSGSSFVQTILPLETVHHLPSVSVPITDVFSAVTAPSARSAVATLPSLISELATEPADSVSTPAFDNVPSPVIVTAAASLLPFPTQTEPDDKAGSAAAPPGAPVGAPPGTIFSWTLPTSSKSKPAKSRSCVARWFPRLSEPPLPPPPNDPPSAFQLSPSQ